MRDLLPLVDVFETPYELSETREPTYEEMLQPGSFNQVIRVGPITYINNHVDAAKHMLKKNIDSDLEFFIKSYLKDSLNYKTMRGMMPSATPKLLADYQSKNSHCDLKKVSESIEINGKELSENQYLFHGGLWHTLAHSFITDRPLSTSFCPHIALRNAEWGGKAYDAGAVDLFVLRVVEPTTKAFCFRMDRTSFGHEVEVLFASGAELEIRSRSHIADHTVRKMIDGRLEQKIVPYYLVEVNMS